VRLAVGIVFTAHGAQKLFQKTPAALADSFGSTGIPFPVLSAWIVIGVELLGGMAVIIGLGTRLVSALFAVIMVVAFAMVHAAHGFFLPNGYEYVFVLFFASLALVLKGAGAFALDNVIGERSRGR
jgi:putative oxidoreductase